MSIEEAIKILKDFNEWRRGSEITPESPTIIGIAIDVIVSHHVTVAVKKTGYFLTLDDLEMFVEWVHDNYDPHSLGDGVKRYKHFWNNEVFKMPQLIEIFNTLLKELKS